MKGVVEALTAARSWSQMRVHEVVLYATDVHGPLESVPHTSSVPPEDTPLTMTWSEPCPVKVATW